MKNKLFLNSVCMAALCALLASCSVSSDPIADTSDPDAEAVSSAKSALVIGYQNTDSSDSVTLDVTLPATGAGGVLISWSSSAVTIVSVSGSVTRPSVGQNDAAVTLTATLSKGSASATKIFALTVSAMTSSFSVAHDWSVFGPVSEPAVFTAVQNGSHVYAGTMNNGLLYSDDSGANWSSKTAALGGIAHVQIYRIAFSGSLVLAGTFDGLTAWDRSGETITNYLGGKKIYDILIDGGNVYLAASDGIYYGSLSALASLNYRTTSFPYPENLFIADGKLYASGQGTEANPEELDVFTLSNMESAMEKIDVISGAYSFTGPVYVNGSVIVAGVNWQIYRSVNGGVSFSADSSTGGGAVTGLVSDGTLLYACKYGSDLWCSADLGVSWKKKGVPGYDGWLGIIANGISFNDGEILISHNKGLVVGALQ